MLANLRTKLEKQVAELVEINETFVKKNAELAEMHSILYTSLSRLISPISLFYHYWGHNPHLCPVNGY